MLSGGGTVCAVTIGVLNEESCDTLTVILTNSYIYLVITVKCLILLGCLKTPEQKYFCIISCRGLKVISELLNFNNCFTIYAVKEQSSEYNGSCKPLPGQ